MRGRQEETCGRTTRTAKRLTRECDETERKPTVDMGHRRSNAFPTTNEDGRMNGRATDQYRSVSYWRRHNRQHCQHAAAAAVAATSTSSSSASSPWVVAGTSANGAPRVPRSKSIRTDDDDDDTATHTQAHTHDRRGNRRRHQSRETSGKSMKSLYEWSFVRVVAVGRRLCTSVSPFVRSSVYLKRRSTSMTRFYRGAL